METVEAAGAFRGLRLVCREWESAAGYSDVCQGEDGGYCIRLSLAGEDCQRDFLRWVSPEDAPMLLERETLRVLYPWTEGMRLREWLYKRRPGLGARRDACLSLLAHCVEVRAAPCVLVLSAREENLRFSLQDDGRMLFLADWGHWRAGMDEGDGVAAAAGLCREILTRDLRWWERWLWPDELRVVCMRVQDGGYRDWGELSRDLSDLPDGLKSPVETVRGWLGELERKSRRFRKPALCVLTCALVLAAILSLASAFRVWQGEKKNIWPGMNPIGDQELNSRAP